MNDSQTNPPADDADDIGRTILVDDGVERTLWGLIRDYITPARLAALITALLGPVVAMLAGKLAVVLAEWGYTLDTTEVMVTFGAAALAVAGVIVTAFRKFMDNRTQYEVAMVNAGKEDLIGAKSLKATLRENGK